jgi:hypothetical protein
MRGELLLVARPHPSLRSPVEGDRLQPSRRGCTRRHGWQAYWTVPERCVEAAAVGDPLLVERGVLGRQDPGYGQVHKS